NVENESGQLRRSDVLFPVELKRHADEGRNRIRELLREVLAALFGRARLLSCGGRAAQDDQHRREPHLAGTIRSHHNSSVRAIPVTDADSSASAASISRETTARAPAACRKAPPVQDRCYCFAIATRRRSSAVIRWL